MRFIKRLFEKRADVFDQYWSSVAAPVASAGVSVSPATAEGISAVYACVSAISETVGTLPLEVFKRTDDGREPAKSHPLYRLLHDEPNGYQTAMEFREQMQRHLLLRGNAYAEIVWSKTGRVEALLPLHPDSVSVLRTLDGKLLYEHNDYRGNTRRLLADEVLHLRYHSDDGILGRSPIQVARDTIGLALAERTHGAKMFEQGTKLSGVIETAPGTTKEQAAQIRDSWALGQAGVMNHGKTAVLPQGAQFKTVSMTLEDAEWIEARKLSVIEVCRLFRCPPVIVQSMESANYSNSVELARQFVTLTLRRHLICWEQAINRACLTNPAYYVEHNVEGLLRGDSLSRAEFYRRGIEDGWLMRSEVRSRENLPAIEGIDDDREETPATQNAQAPVQGSGDAAGGDEEAGRPVQPAQAKGAA